MTTAYSDFLGLARANLGGGRIAGSQDVNLGPLGGAGSGSIPWVTNPPALSWVAEGDPFPITDATAGTITVSPKIAAVGLALSSKADPIEPRRANFHPVVALCDVTSSRRRLVFRHRRRLPSSRPGYWLGVTPIAGYGTLADDLAALTDEIVGNGAGQDIVFITNPGRALAARIISNTALPIYGTAAVSDAVIAVDAACFFHSVVPELRTSAARQPWSWIPRRQARRRLIAVCFKRRASDFPPS